MPFLVDLKNLQTKLFRFSNKLLHRQNLASPASEVLGIMVIAALMWYGGKLVLVDGSLDAQLFIVYLALAYQILTPAKAISKASYSVKRGNAAAERVLEILETESTIKDKPDAREKSDFNKIVEIDNISFKYEDDWVLEKFQFKGTKRKYCCISRTKW